MSDGTSAAERNRSLARIERLVLLACDRAAARLAARHERGDDDEDVGAPESRPPDKLDLDILKTLLPHAGKQADRDARSVEADRDMGSSPTAEQMAALLSELQRLGARPAATASSDGAS